MRDVPLAMRALAVVLLCWVAGTVAGCRDCDQENEVAAEFLERPENLSCASDSDCIAVSTGCHTYDRGTCGQAQLNADAASSHTWHQLATSLADCEGECDQCLALLVPHCVDGFCGGRR